MKQTHAYNKNFQNSSNLKCIHVIYFKFPVDCDAMMHVLKDSINLKYSELLTKAISKCNLI